MKFQSIFPVKIRKKYFKLSSAEIFTQPANHKILNVHLYYLWKVYKSLTKYGVRLISQ